MKKGLIIGIFILIMMALVLADIIPTDDWNFQNFYNLWNVSNFSTNYYCNVSNNSQCYELYDFLTSAGGGINMWIDGGSYLYPNSTFADNLRINGWIQANNWTNITITENQISDLDHYTDADIDGNEAAFNGWDKNESNDFSGNFTDLNFTGTIGFNDFVDNDTIIEDTNCSIDQSCNSIVYNSETTEWDKNNSDDFSGKFTDLNFTSTIGFADFVDNDTDTTYTAGSNLTLTDTTFAINITSLTNFFKTIFLEINDNLDWNNLINKPPNLDEDSTDDLITSTSFGGEVSGTYNNILLDNNALDDQYIELGDSFGGDVSGTYDNLIISDNSHNHSCQNITGANYDICTNPNTDTNASTACSNDEVLLGNGTCYDSSNFRGGTNYYPTSVNLTAGTYNGSLINGSNTGYAAGNAICNIEFNGHMCDEFEIFQWFANTASPNLNADAWINSGGPKYIPASVPVNDCKGWTHGSAGTYLGNYMHFNSTTGGDSRALNCGTFLKLACCVY